MPRITIHEINAALKGRVGEFCREYLPGGYIDGEHWRCSNIFGDKPKDPKGGDGSFVVDLKGDEVGKFHDFSGGDHGDLLDILHERFGKDYLREAKRFLGWENGTTTEKARPEPVANLLDETAEQKDTHYRQQAQEMWDKSRELADTDGAKYLRGRGIDLDPWPACFRYNSRVRFKQGETEGGPKQYTAALMARVVAADGGFLGIQRVPIRQGKKVPGAKKKSLGNIAGGAIQLTPAKRILGICEGPEKGASLVAMGIVNWLNLSPARNGAT